MFVYALHVFNNLAIFYGKDPITVREVVRLVWGDDDCLPLSDQVPDDNFLPNTLAHVDIYRRKHIV